MFKFLIIFLFGSILIYKGQANESLEDKYNRVHKVNRTVIPQMNPYRSKNPYHLAIIGRGFFHVKSSSGEDAYTRSGMFTLGQDRIIVTLGKYKIQPEIKIPQDMVNFKITSQGEVKGESEDRSTVYLLGNIQLADFINPEGLRIISFLKAEGSHNEFNLYQETLASGKAILGQPKSEAYRALWQGWYEGPFVDVNKEILSLMNVQKSEWQGEAGCLVNFQNEPQKISEELRLSITKEKKKTSQ